MPLSTIPVSIEDIRVVSLKKKLARRGLNRYSLKMSSHDEKTEKITVRDLENAALDTMRTSKLPAIGGKTVLIADLQSQRTVNRKVPQDLLSSVKQTRPMPAIADISTTLLEPVFEDIDSTLEIPKLSIEIQKMAKKEDDFDGLEFSASIDASGRIQLPARYLSDPRIQPGRKMKIRIAFEDLS